MNHSQKLSPLKMTMILLFVFILPVVVGLGTFAYIHSLSITPWQSMFYLICTILAINAYIGILLHAVKYSLDKNNAETKSHHKFDF